MTGDRVDAETGEIALTPDDVLDLYALYDHIGAVLATHQAKEQNA